MKKLAPQIKASFDILKKNGLNMTLVAGWEGVLAKYGEYEDVLEQVLELHPKAVEMANNPSSATDSKLAEFLELQNKGLKLRQDLLAPVAKFDAGRLKLYDIIALMPDKKKSAECKSKLQEANGFLNMMAKIKDQLPCFAPVTPKPRKLEGPDVGNAPAAKPAASTKKKDEPVYANNPAITPTKKKEDPVYANNPAITPTKKKEDPVYANNPAITPTKKKEDPVYANNPNASKGQYGVPIPAKEKQPANASNPNPSKGQYGVPIPAKKK